VSEDNRVEVPRTPEEWQEATDDLVYLMDVCARERTLTPFPTRAGALRALAVPNTGRSEDYPFDVEVVGTLALGKHPRDVSGSYRYITVKDRHKKPVHPKEAATFRSVVRDAWEADGPHTPLHDLHNALDACLRYTTSGGSETAARDGILRWGTSDLEGLDRTVALEMIAEGFDGTVRELRDAAMATADARQDAVEATTGE